MKIRIKGDSIRLRLTQGEVTQFATEGVVEESIHFPGKALRYRLLHSKDATEMKAEFHQDTISLAIPWSAGTEWTETDLVGLEWKQKLPSGKELALLVEKDFQCLTPRVGEKESDHFPNPLASQQ